MSVYFPNTPNQTYFLVNFWKILHNIYETLLDVYLCFKCNIFFYDNQPLWYVTEQYVFFVL